MYRPYVVISPPWETTSGGIRVMYGLYGYLLARGQEVYLNQYPNTDFIAIYPEIIQGNPTNAKTVVRYILNKPGVMGVRDERGGFIPGQTSFDPTEKIYYFSKLFGEAEDGKHYMFLPILNTHLFKDQKKLRNKAAYFIGKGINTNIHPTSAILIDRGFASDQQALADLLNECEVLYCYDPVTAMTELARLCGCRIVMINPIYSKDEFKEYEPGMNGISWGEDNHVPFDVKGFREHYFDLKFVFGGKLDHFIESTQK